MLEPLSIDHEAFARDLTALRAEIEATIGPEDLAHLQKIERWGRWCTGLGYATAWIAPNPFSALAIAQGNTTRWAIMMHHVGHRGYDRVPGVPPVYTGRGFAAGARRFVDWLDWMVPAAWRYEHNALHHSRTGEVEDPDLVEQNTAWLRASKMPLLAKYGVVAFFACTWKLTFYAPSTFLTWRRAEQQRATGKPAAPDEIRHVDAFNPLTEEGRAFWKTCLLPYATARFAVAPALFSPLGPWAVFSVLANSAAAEVLANLHSFCIIAPNHAGDDLYRFEGRAAGKDEFFVRQVVGSVNYATGNDVIDFLQGFLNYQIEHHLWADLPALKYQQYQPRVKAICEKHGVPYVQESIFRRVKKLVDVMVGTATMKKMAPVGDRVRRQGGGKVAKRAAMQMEEAAAEE
jgi:fatty acid desaturase